MKNLVMIAVLLMATFLAYNYFSRPNIDTVNPPPTSNNTLGKQDSLSAKGASVSIIAPLDGAVVSSPMLVKFGINNMKIAPAGSNLENSGHHHLLINMQTLPDLTQPLPATEQLIHFGGGQTETSIELAPGKHTLQLVLGDYLHTPHKTPVVSKKITVHVKSPSPLSR